MSAVVPALTSCFNGSRKGDAMQVLAIDFETADKRSDSACALGLSVVVDGAVVDSWYSLIRPPRPDILFSYIHGLYWDDVKDAPVFADVWQEVTPYLDGI